MIRYVKGDATKPQLAEGETALIVHVCNDRHTWGRGFVLALSRRWPQPEAEYRAWHRSGSNERDEPFQLGNIQLVQVGPQLYVVNMVAQAGYSSEGKPALRLDALEDCLCGVALLAKQMTATVHMPRIGTGLGGSSWTVVEPLVNKQLQGIPVTVYDLP